MAVGDMGLDRENVHGSGPLRLPVSASSARFKSRDVIRSITNAVGSRGSGPYGLGTQPQQDTHRPWISSFSKNSVLDFVQTHQAYAPFVLGLMTFADSLAFVSLLLPTMTILIAVGFVLAAADIPFWQAWIGAVCGAFLGNWVSYAIGRRYKEGRL